MSLTVPLSRCDGAKARLFRNTLDGIARVDMGERDRPAARVLVPHKGWGPGRERSGRSGDKDVGKSWVVVCHRWKLHGKRPCRYLPQGAQSFFIRRCNLVFTLTSRPWKGICVVGCLKMGKGSITSDKPQMVWEFPDMKKKTASADNPAQRHLVAVESNILRDLVPLIEHMAVTRYDDGDARLTGWVTVKTQGAAWVVQVKDPDSGNSFQVVDASLDKALETASLMLACDEAPWSPDPFLKSKAASKKK